MFYYFFENYKENIYKTSQRKLKWFEVLLIISPFLSYIYFLFSVVTKSNEINKIVSLVFIVVFTISLYIYSKIRIKRRGKQLSDYYRKNRIGKLEELLKSNDYNLYSLGSIDWLILCCDRKIDEHTSFKGINDLKTLLSTTFFPVFTLCLGSIIKDANADEIAYFIIAFAIVIFCMFIVYESIKPVLTFIIFPEKNIVEYLRDELEYIKTQLNPNNYNNNNSRL